MFLRVLRHCGSRQLLTEYSMEPMLIYAGALAPALTPRDSHLLRCKKTRHEDLNLLQMEFRKSDY